MTTETRPAMTVDPKRQLDRSSNMTAGPNVIPTGVMVSNMVAFDSARAWHFH
jgi:hypothetical protein